MSRGSCSPLAVPCFVQSTSDEGLAKQAQNAITNMISLPSQNNTKGDMRETAGA